MSSTQSIAALSVSLALNSGTFQQQINAINAQVKNLDAAFKAAGQGVSGFESTIGGLQAKIGTLEQKIGAYNEKLTQQSARYTELNKSLSEAQLKMQEYENTLGKGSAEYAQQAQAAAGLARQLTNLDTEIARTNGNIREMESALAASRSSLTIMEGNAARSQTAFGRMTTSVTNFANKMTETGSKMKSFGTNMATSFGFADAALVVPLKKAIDTAAEFQKTMAEVGAKSGTTGQALKNLGTEAQNVATKTGVGANDIAEAMNVMAGKGYKAGQITESVMKAIANTSIASSSSVESSAEAIAGAMESYQMNTSQAGMVADVFAKGIDSTGVSMSDMSIAMQYAGSSAHNLGVPIQELTSLVGNLSKNNFSGQKSGAALRDAMIRLSNPPKAARAELEKLNISVKDSHGNFVGMTNILQQVTEKTAGMTKIDKEAAVAKIFGVTASSEMLALMGPTIDKVKATTAALEGSKGASDRLAQNMRQNLNGQLKALQSQFQNMQIVVGTALIPALLKIVAAITSMATAFNNLSPGTKQFIAIAAGVVAALLGLGAVIGVVVAAVGNLVLGVGGLIKFLVGIPAMVAKVQMAMLAVDPPMLAVIAVIAAMIAIGYELYKNWDSIKAQAANFGNYMKGVWDNIKNWTIGAWNNIKSATVSIWNSITGFFHQWGGLMLAALMGPIGILVYEIATHWNQIKSTAASVWNSIRSEVASIINSMRSAISSGLSAISSTASNIWNSIRSTAVSVWNGIKSNVAAIVNGLKSEISSIINGIRSAVSSAMSGIEGILTRPFEAAKNTISGIIGGIKGAISGVTSAVGSIFNTENPIFVANPTDGTSAVGALNVPEMGIMGGSMTDSIASLSDSVGGSVTGGTMYSGGSAAIQNQFNEAILVDGLTSQNQKLDMQNQLMKQLIDLMSAGQQIAVNIDGKQVALATANHMDTALRRNRDNTSRARGGK